MRDRIVYSDSEQCAPCPPCVCPGDIDKAKAADLHGASFATAMPAAHPALRLEAPPGRTKLAEAGTMMQPLDMVLCAGIVVIVVAVLVAAARG